ncbi:MAG TPA: hypothetical protein VKT49_19375 [Bryobacteraceae bacterium]|nr:hypothetical protein [Bryobacteraceae bacterium]
MPTKTSSRRQPFELLRGGKVPQAFLQRRIADARRTLEGRFHHKDAITRQYAKYWGQIQKPTKPVERSPRAAQAIEGLLALHKKLARKRLAAPPVLGEIGGIFPGRFGATVTPPFDYAFTIPFLSSGNPALTGSANKNTGQLTGSAITDSQAPSAGSMYTEMGIYLHPMFGPAILTVSAHPAFSIEWWTNSLSTDATVVSFGQAGLGIYAQTGEIGPTNGAFSPFDSWDEEITQQLLFDFGSNPHIPVSVQLPVDPSFNCALFISTVNHVQGVGWPGSLAGSMLSVTLPSITFELDAILVSNPGLVD